MTFQSNYVFGFYMYDALSFILSLLPVWSLPFLYLTKSINLITFFLSRKPFNPTYPNTSPSLPTTSPRSPPQPFLLPGGYLGCCHGYPGHPGGHHWSCCGKMTIESECGLVLSSTVQDTVQPATVLAMT